MHFEAELDDIHAERLLQLQRRLRKPLPEVVAELLTQAVDNLPTLLEPETEGQAVLRLLEEHGLLGCIEGDGRLSVEYKKHLWGNE
jgi:hypothetical protein